MNMSTPTLEELEKKFLTYVQDKNLVSRHVYEAYVDSKKPGDKEGEIELLFEGILKDKLSEKETTEEYRAGVLDFKSRTDSARNESLNVDFLDQTVDEDTFINSKQIFGTKTIIGTLCSDAEHTPYYTDDERTTLLLVQKVILMSEKLRQTLDKVTELRVMHVMKQEAEDTNTE